MKQQSMKYKNETSRKSDTSWRLFSDGGSRGNPGSAAYGFVLFNGEKIVKKKGEYIGETTNNVAEYSAIVAGLLEALHHTKHVACFLDSELAVKQIKGEYRVKDEKLKPLYKEVIRLSELFDEISFTHVRREYNKLADQMVNEALDRRG